MTALGSAGELFGLDNLRGLSQPEQFHDSMFLPKDAAATNIPLWVLQGGAPQEPGLSLSLVTPPRRCCELRGRGQIQQHHF